MIHLHHLDATRAAQFLGLVVTFELHNGNQVEGRVEAVDEWRVYLLSKEHPTLALHDIKQVVNPPF
jgi:sRNA-binding regulator protein Hfq